MENPRIAIIAGEASGDLHGALLAGHLREMSPQVRIWGAGGKRMREAGVDLIWESGSTGAIGIAEALKLTPGLLFQYFRIRHRLLRTRPDVLTLIDFGAFNKRVAGFARRHGIQTVYHMPPGAWRKRRRRAPQADLADKFTTPFDWSYHALKAAGADVTLIGHPLLDAVRPTMDESRFRAEHGLEPETPIVGLLPGSRKQEIAHILPAVLGAIRLIEARRPGLHYVVAAAGKTQARAAARFISNTASGPGWPEIRIAESLTYDVLAYSRLVITASGTATLEAAILNTPMVIVYCGSLLSYVEFLLRGKKVLEDHIGLPNIIAERRICPELLGKEASPENIATLALGLLSDPSKMAAMKDDLMTVRSVLGAEGGARMAAKVILDAVAQASTN